MLNLARYRQCTGYKPGVRSRRKKEAMRKMRLFGFLVAAVFAISLTALSGCGNGYGGGGGMYATPSATMRPTPMHT
jgi:hypothetical protein